jgi:hypothetical protein
MGVTPKQDDLASRERRPRHDQLKAEALTSDELERARARATMFDLPVVDETAIAMSRAAALLIVFSNLFYAAQHRYTSGSTFDATQSLILASMGVGVVFFLLTFTVAILRYWREIAILVCTGDYVAIDSNSEKA